MKKLLFALLITIGLTGNSCCASEGSTKGFCGTTKEVYINHHLAFNIVGSAAVGAGAVGLWYLAAKEEDQSLIQWLKENPKQAAAIFLLATGGTLAVLERDAIKGWWNKKDQKEGAAKAEKGNNQPTLMKNPRKNYPPFISQQYILEPIPSDEVTTQITGREIIISAETAAPLNLKETGEKSAYQINENLANQLNTALKGLNILESSDSAPSRLVVLNNEGYTVFCRTQQQSSKSQSRQDLKRRDTWPGNTQQLGQRYGQLRHPHFFMNVTVLEPAGLI